MCNEKRKRWIENSIDSYQSYLINYAIGFLNSEDLAKDVVQESFIKLWSQDMERIGTNVKSWLFRVCRNRCLDILKKENKNCQLTDSTVMKKVTTNESPDKISSKQDELEIVNNLILQMTDKQQEIIKLKFQHQLSYKEIANILDISTSNVGVVIHEAILKLKKQTAGLA